jgi:hypothetical protein
MTGAGQGLTHGVISRIVRLNPLITPAFVNGQWTAPPGWTAAQFHHLCQIDMDAVEQNDVSYIDSWCELWMANNSLNQPIRMDGKTLTVELGYATYAQATTAWNQLYIQ